MAPNMNREKKIQPLPARVFQLKDFLARPRRIITKQFPFP